MSHAARVYNSCSALSAALFGAVACLRILANLIRQMRIFRIFQRIAMDAGALARTSYFLSTIPMGGEATSTTSTASATTSQYQFVKRNTRRAPSYQVPRVNYAAPAKNLSVKIPWKWQWDAGIIHISFISCGAFAVARSARHPSRLIAGSAPTAKYDLAPLERRLRGGMRPSRAELVLTSWTCTINCAVAARAYPATPSALLFTCSTPRGRATHRLRETTRTRSCRRCRRSARPR